MRIVIQRVSQASVTVDDKCVGSIGKGVLVLFAVHQDVRNHNLKVETGIFGAKMQVSLVNDGPVTLILDAK